MKIDSYSLGMESERNYQRKTQRSETVKQAFLSFDGFNEPEDEFKEEKEDGGTGKADSLDSAYRLMNSRIRTRELSSVDTARDEFNRLHQMMMQEILAYLTGTKPKSDCYNSFKTERFLPVEYHPLNVQIRVQSVSIEESFEETETTGFTAQGLVKTSDGRELGVNLNINMTRSFSAKYSEAISMTELALRDPLVVNFDTGSTSLQDMTFLFDLDADGTEEEISMPGQGSGFLAIDKNGDGIINDGSELFGTKSGNGFRDLAKYDLDGNNWIDENDDIFSKLKIYSKDFDGNDVLYTLKDLDIGAIYLGYEGTEFSLNDMMDNSTRGIIRNTGIFLREDGTAGTIQHVDFAS